MAVVALFVFRRHLPELMRRVTSGKVKVPGGELEFTAQEAAALATERLAEAAEEAVPESAPAERRIPAGLDSPEITYTPRTSQTKVFRSLRMNLYRLAADLGALYGLPRVEHDRPLHSPLPDLWTAPPRWEDIAQTLRYIAADTGIEGWDRLAEAVLAMKVFADQPGPADSRATMAALLAQSTWDRARDLTARTLQAMPANPAGARSQPGMPG